MIHKTGEILTESIKALLPSTLLSPYIRRIKITYWIYGQITYCRDNYTVELYPQLLCMVNRQEHSNDCLLIESTTANASHNCGG